MHKLIPSSVVAGALYFGFAGIAYAGAGDPAHPDLLAQKLHDRGYHHIQIEEGRTPGPQAYACKGNTHFHIDFDPSGNIQDVDPIGDCYGQKGPKQVHVQAPFVDVKVGKGVRVRAPFVDLNIR